MSRAGRIGLVAAAIVVVAGAFLIARPGDDADEPATTQTTEADQQPTATARSAPPPPDPEPAVTQILLEDHVVEGGVADIEVERGDRVRIIVRSNIPDSIHIHGYDLEQSASPGSPARFSFPASIEGIFEIESHEAEHAGADPLIARLVVEPS